MNKTRLEDVKDNKTGLPVIHPETGDVQQREVSNRRVGYDFTFSVPKSVSVYLAVNEDKVVEQMIAEALDETMAMIEARMETKVRKGYLSVLGRGRLVGFPFFSLSASRYFGDKQTLCLYWPIGTVVIAGPKVLDFYAGFCAHRATCLKADGKDIKVLNLILSGDSDGTNETDPSNRLKTEK